MEVKETVPVISDIIVVIDGVKYKDDIEALCSIEVTCHCICTKDDIPTFIPISASCEEPYFLTGKAFWKEVFGKRQTNRIVKLCEKAVKEYLKKEGIA